MSSGAESRHQSETWVYCSLCVRPVGCGWPQPTSPTTSMSGSFQWPGPAKEAQRACWKPMPDMLPHVSVMSPVVRHELDSRDQSDVNGAELERLKTTSRPELRS